MLPRFTTAIDLPKYLPIKLSLPLRRLIAGFVDTSPTVEHDLRAVQTHMKVVDELDDTAEPTSIEAYRYFLWSLHLKYPNHLTKAEATKAYRTALINQRRFGIKYDEPFQPGMAPGGIISRKFHYVTYDEVIRDFLEEGRSHLLPSGELLHLFIHPEGNVSRMPGTHRINIPPEYWIGSTCVCGDLRFFNETGEMWTHHCTNYYLQPVLLTQRID